MQPRRQQKARLTTRSTVALLARFFWFCALLPVMSSAQAIFNAEVNDVWATAGESGWGLQIVEQGEIAFTTLFVNDASTRPTFFTAFMTRSGTSAWSGDLIETKGPYFGSAGYDLQLFGARKAGTINFTKLTSGSAKLEYSVDGVSVSKTVTRELWRFVNDSGSYIATVFVVTSHCSNSADDGERTGSYPIVVSQTGTAYPSRPTSPNVRARRAPILAILSGRPCRRGRHELTCTDGDEGAMSFFELTERTGMIAGRLQGHSITDSCDYNGRSRASSPCRSRGKSGAASARNPATPINNIA